MKATHTTVENLTNRQLANRVLKALTALQGISNGTVSKPFEYASIIMTDGRTLIQTVLEDGYLRYNDGYLIVEVDDYSLYVDYSTQAIKEWDLKDYEY